MNQNPGTYSAIELLDAYVALKDAIARNELGVYGDSRYYRFQELSALLRAFGLDLDSLANGDFLGHRTVEELQPLLADMNRYTLESSDMAGFMETFTLDRINGFHFQMQWIYREYLRLIHELRKLARFNEGYLEAGSLGWRYVIERTSAIIDTIDFKRVDEIKAMLALLIDPQQRQFTKSQMIQEYGFPNVDIRAIQIDEI